MCRSAAVRGAGLLLRSASWAFLLGFIGFPLRAQGQAGSGSDTGVDQRSEDVIVVQARREGTSIDGTWYEIAATPRAATIDGAGLLNELPLVRVSDEGVVELLGRSGVTILIDGTRLPDAVGFLKGIRASQIRRVEVITNASARYPAAGGGVINVVLRRNYDAKKKVNASVAVSTLGAIDASLTPSFGGSDLSLSATITPYILSRANSGKILRVQKLEDGLWTIRERFRSHVASRSLSGVLNGNLKVRGGGTLTTLVNLGLSRTQRSSRYEELGVTRFQQERGVTEHRNLDGIVSYEARDEGENTYKLTAGHSVSFTRFRLELPPASSQPFFLQRVEGDGNSLAVDLTRKLGPAVQARLGAEFRRNSEHRDQFVRGERRYQPPSAERFNGSIEEWSTYGDLQARASKLTVLAGMRFERRAYRSAYTGEARRYDEELPSLHLEHVEGSRTLRASYSEAVSWPNLSDLFAIPRYSDSRTVYTGNSGLRLERSHTVEASYRWARKNTSFNLVAHARRTSSPYTIVVLIDGDTKLLGASNLGSKETFGLAASYEAPLTQHISHSSDFNLAHSKRHFAFQIPHAKPSSVGASGSYRLRYSEKNADKAGGDQINLQLDYSKGRSDGFVATPSSLTLYMDWTHRLGGNLATVVSVSGVHFLRSREIFYRALNGFYIEEDTSRRLGLKASLVWTP